MAGEHYEVCVIPIDGKDAANIDANKVDAGKTSKTFTVQLWDEKADCKVDFPTHLWYCWWMSDQESTELKKDFSGTPDVEGIKYKSKVFNLRDGWTPESILKKMKLKTYDVALTFAKLK